MINAYIIYTALAPLQSINHLSYYHNIFIFFLLFAEMTSSIDIYILCTTNWNMNKHYAVNRSMRKWCTYYIKTVCNGSASQTNYTYYTHVIIITQRAPNERTHLIKWIICRSITLYPVRTCIEHYSILFERLP
jgi:hypothetical protein